MDRQTFEGNSLRDICYGYGEESSLASVVVEGLKKTEKIAAESLTAGLFQATSADFSGVSAIFNGGFVTSLEEKSKMPIFPIRAENTGSFQFTARKMAEQARLKTQSDYGVVDGVAGPDSLEGIQPAQFFI